MDSFDEKKFHQKVRNIMYCEETDFEFPIKELFKKMMSTFEIAVVANITRPFLLSQSENTLSNDDAISIPRDQKMDVNHIAALFYLVTQANEFLLNCSFYGGFSHALPSPPYLKEETKHHSNSRYSDYQQYNPSYGTICGMSDFSANEVIGIFLRNFKTIEEIHSEAHEILKHANIEYIDNYESVFGYDSEERKEEQIGPLTKRVIRDAIAELTNELKTKSLTEINLKELAEKICREMLNFSIDTQLTFIKN